MILVDAQPIKIPYHDLEWYNICKQDGSRMHICRFIISKAYSAPPAAP